MQTFEEYFCLTREFLERTIQDAIGMAEENKNKELLDKLLILDDVFYSLADMFENKE